MVGRRSHDKRKTLLLPFCESTGVPPEQKRADDKALELEAWRKSKLKRKTPFTMAKFNYYFENQARINAGK